MALAPWALDPARLTPGPAPELLWGRQVSRARNERTNAGPGRVTLNLEPHTHAGFQPRMFEHNVIQLTHTGFYYEHVPVGMCRSSSGCFLARIVSLRCVLFWPGECEFILDRLNTFERRPAVFELECSLALSVQGLTITHTHTLSLSLLVFLSLPCGPSSLCWSMHNR